MAKAKSRTSAKKTRTAKKATRRPKARTKSSSARIVESIDRKILDLAPKRYGKIRKEIRVLAKKSKSDLVLELGAKVLARVKAFRKKPLEKKAHL